MKASTTLIFFAIVTTTASACGDRLLVGQDPDGGSPQTGAAGTIMTGAAGNLLPTTGAGGVTGAAGQPTTGAAGQPPTTGAAGIAGSGPPTTTKVVTPLRIPANEAVTRLAEVIWREPPSLDLLSQAQNGRFKTTDDLYGAVRQLLADPRARVGLGAFYRWWLKLDDVKDAPIDGLTFPAYTADLGAEMAAETETFAVNATLAPSQSFNTLMTAPYSYINEKLANIYGVAGVTGDQLRQVPLDSKQRAGIVTQPALQVLSATPKRNSPPRRGLYMLSRFQCFEVPAPPPNVEPLPDTLPPNVTVRQALAMKASTQAACAACHALLDPPGLAFETFDAIGRWRTTDNGLPVDMSNLWILNLSSDGTPSPVDGPVEYARLLTGERAQECMARQWLSYVTGASVSQLDERVVQRVTQTFRESNFDLKELIFAALTSDPFLAP